MTGYDNTKYSTTMPPDYGLSDLVAFLVDLANDGVLNKEGKQQLTPVEHARLRGHADKLTGAIKFLTDGQPPDVLDQLQQALGSTAVIASYAVQNLLVERKELEHLAKRVGLAAEAKKAQSQKIDDAIVMLASPIWRKHLSLDEWQVTDKIRDELNERLALEKPLGREAIRNRLERLKPRILS
jgi:cysteinyl-tRNA synthetase